VKIYADDIDITITAGGIAWQNTLAELATTLNFEVAKLDAQHTKIYLPQEGSIVRLNADEEFFRGIILTVDDGSKTSNKYTAVDFGFYLNKNSETYQFTDASANQAITQICGNFGIPIDSLCALPLTFSKIYLDKSAAEVIWDILEQTAAVLGYAYNFDVTPKGLRVYRLGDLIASPRFRLSENTQWYNSVDLRGGVSHSVSIEDLKNSVKVVSGDEKGFTLIAAEQNAELISKYGLLQTVEKINEKELGNAANLARQKMSELSQKKETFSFEIIEADDCYTRAGYEIEVDGAKFIIEGSSHSIKNGIHYVKLDLRRAKV
jgi:hypothetical protein